MRGLGERLDLRWVLGRGRAKAPRRKGARCTAASPCSLGSDRDQVLCALAALREPTPDPAPLTDGGAAPAPANTALLATSSARATSVQRTTLLATLALATACTPSPLSLPGFDDVTQKIFEID